MHFIEQLFRMSPDGGSGACELFLTFVLVFAITVREFTKRNPSNTFPSAAKRRGILQA
jgi:hypothetical protein